MSLKTETTLADRARACLPGGVSSRLREIPALDGFVIARTGAATLTDNDGRTFIDFHAAFGPPLLGRHDEDVDDAFVKAARTYDLPGVGVTGPEIEAAERVKAVIPSCEKVLLVNSGSEATFHAVRLARAVTGRRYLVKFQGCYHGWHDSVAMNVISPAEMIGQKDPLSSGILPDALDATLIAKFNDLPSVEAAFDERGREIAAVIVEPIQHNVGCVLPKEGFLEGLRTLCDKNDTLLIFDEVITGFRHDLGGYQRVCGVTPDLTTLGKAAANGYPIGVLGGRSDVMDLLSLRSEPQVFGGGTFNGHPAVAAALVATIDKLEREPVHQHIFELGDKVRRGLVSLYEKIGIQAVVSGFGSVWVSYFLDPPVDCYEDLLRNDAELFVGYRLELMEHGFFELPVNLKRNHLSYAHSHEQVDHLLAATELAVSRVLGQR